MLNNKRASQKERARPKQKERVNGSLVGHGVRIRIGIRIKETKTRSKGQKTEKERERRIVRFVANQVIKLISAGGTISNKDLRISNHLRTQGMFTIFESSGSTNSDSTTRSAGFQDLRPAAQLQQPIRVTHPHTMGQCHLFCLWQAGGFSGRRLNSITSLNPLAQIQGSKRFVLHFLPHHLEGRPGQHS